MRALIAMSGGVDSSVAAYLMKQAGYECIGATMLLYDNGDIGIDRRKTCCSLDDVEDAGAVAHRLGIPHYTFNFKDDFADKVIRKFVSSYENGITPNPCIDCNRYLKFEALYRRAMELSCDVIVTGHYARTAHEDGRYLLKKAADVTKDQSYVLYSMTQEQLAHTVFPCGELTKTEVRRIAEEQGFYNASKPDSQDICFVPDGDYTAFIRRCTGNSYPPGDFVDREGNVLGQHSGIINYTVGQRKGLGISADRPLYVCKVDAAENKVVLGHSDELFSRELDIADLHWSAFDGSPRRIKADVKIRYRHAQQPAEIISTGEASAHIVFDEPQRAITRGQAAVIYEGGTVLGGGIIV